MSEQDGDQPAAGQEAAEPEVAEREPAEQETAEPRKVQRSKQQQEPFDSGGTESSREMREVSRRRRDAEEKLQQHLLEAKDKPAED
jgi:septal ring-binding cell division protein DamX